MDFGLTVMSPGLSLYEGRAEGLVVPTLNGYIGILPGHVPLMSVLGKGEIQIKTGSETKTLPVSGGIIYISPDKVSVVTG